MIKIRKVKLSDIQVIYEWRNDELTRKMSNNTDFVQWEEHNAWIKASLKNKNRLFLLCETENTEKKIGLVHFRVVVQRALVSINLSPEMRGKRLSKLCLSVAINHFSKQYSQVITLDAEIKSVNTASQRAFESVGFIKVQENNGMLHYKRLLG